MKFFVRHPVGVIADAGDAMMDTNCSARIGNSLSGFPEGPALIPKNARRAQVLALVIIICIVSGSFFTYAERESATLTLQNESLCRVNV